ncbi:HAD family hydrolase [Thiorhodococcus fuscus]|uniref:HAD family hydrolase n=1 Tax=Thiorhodococcus fuscus TaxID=527200 RepID=A0ABW4Y3S8_9GAMM
MPTTLLFDLDGTLIDSSASILAAMSGALTREGIDPVVPLDESLIGPPLRQTLSRITDCGDLEVIERLAAHFREVYDTVGYRQTRVYPGVDDSLCTLAASGSRMFIVTNKRIYPTRLILEMLGWTDLFSGIYTLDSVSPAAASKGVLIAQLMREHSILAHDACLIGDTPEDAQAAHDNGLRFVGVSWGYGLFAPDVLRDRPLLNDGAEIARLRCMGR